METQNRTLALFQLFAHLRQAASLTDIARGLEIPMSSCFNLVKSLQTLGFLYAVDKKRFYPTRRLYDIASAISESDAWMSKVEAELEKLRNVTHETIAFGKRQNNQVVLLKVFEGSYQVRFHAKAGDTVPLLSSAQGRVILSQLPVKEREALVGKMALEKITRLTVTNKNELLRLLEEAERNGYVILHGEVIAELDAIAMPVRLNGEIHTIAIAGPKSRMSKNMNKHKMHLEATCEALTEA